MGVRSLGVALLLAVELTAPLAPVPAWGQEISSTLSDPATLRAAAEAIDPLAESAASEAAWQSWLEALEASGGAVADQSLALNRIGDARYYQQNFEGALAASQEALQRLEAAGEGDSEIMAETLANVATFYGVTGHAENEIPLQTRAFEIRKRLYGTDPNVLDPPAAKALGMGYLNYATLLYERGRFGEAAELTKPAIDGLIRGEVRDATLFIALSSGANMLVDGGQTVAALAMAERGAQLATELLPAGHPFIGFAKATLAKVLIQTDRFEEAEGPAREALDIMAEKLGPAHRNTLVAMHNLGVILAELGHYDEAIALVGGRRDLATDETPGEIVLSLVTASNAAWEGGRTDLAMSLGEEARDIALTLPETDRRAASGLLTYALRLEERGDFAGSLALLKRAALISRKSGEAPDPAIAIRRGLLTIRAGDAQGGWAIASEGGAGLRAAMLADANRFELGADLPSYYEPLMQLAEAAIAANRPDDALAAFELASWGVNARSRQLLALREAVGGNAETAADVDTLRDGRDRLRLLSRERAAMLAAGQVAAAEEHAAEMASVGAAVDAAGERLRQAVPDIDRWLEPSQVGVAAIQQSLDPDQAVLVVMPSRNRVLSMAITRDGVAMEQAEGGRPRVRPLVDRLRAALDGTAEFPVDAAIELERLAMPGSVGKLLESKPRIAVVTSDALSRLPFGILLPDTPAPAQRNFRAMDWLARSHAFSVALTPSLAFADGAASGARPGFLGVGDPRLAGAPGSAIDAARLWRGSDVSLDDIRALPALPATAAEVGAVARALGGGASVTLTGADATEPRVRSEGPGVHGVVLFATHGLLGGEIGGLREPALVLTPPERTDAADDGLLQASEIAALGIDADFVILSACNSAAGRNTYAPAYTGLANAFLGSGTRSLMLSHWRVRDDAAAFLSAETVRGANAGLDRAEALRRAQMALIDSALPDAANPAVWAPFVLVEN